MMLFCSRQFLLFFSIVFVLYWALPTQRARTCLLLVASYVFYASWSTWLVRLIVATATADYLLALWMENTPKPWLKRTLLVGSIAGNLGVLCYFKYANFFLDSLRASFEAGGLSLWTPTLQVIIPLGISFYTFESINYMVDVYRGKLRAERNLGNFLLFILFFPHLVAGPIVRAHDFLPQIQRQRVWNWTRMRWGAEFILLGLIKKLAIADRMAWFSDPVFNDPELFRTSTLWLALIAYTIQIYCDFSGYTDIAIGSALLLGYKLSRNFAMPYISRNVAEFWRRWHISLSTWLRDYLFIPLGGSRGGRWRTHFNLMATMALGGLWHGASWTFVAWGIWHGALLCLHREFKSFSDRWPRWRATLEHPAGIAARVLLTLLAVMVGWVLFRATSFGDAATYLRHMFLPAAGAGVPVKGLLLIGTLGVVIVAHAAALTELRRRVRRLPAPAYGLGYACMLFLALVLAPMKDQAFIYFQF